MTCSDSRRPVIDFIRIEAPVPVNKKIIYFKIIKV